MVGSQLGLCRRSIPAAQLPAQQVHRVGVLREHHRLGEAFPAQLADHVLQFLHLAVRRQAAHAVEQSPDVGGLLEGERLLLERGHLVDFPRLVRRLVVGNVVVQAG